MKHHLHTMLQYRVFDVIVSHSLASKQRTFIDVPDIIINDKWIYVVCILALT